MDGQREHHDFSVCREGGYDIAFEGIREAVNRGFRVTTNTTLFDGADPKSVRAFFDEMMELGVEGMMLSPGYSYDKAPDQQHFLGRARTRKLFRTILANRKKRWRFNQSPAVSRIPDGQAALRLHAVGHADVQHLRLAEAVLSAPGRLRRHVRRADGDHRVAATTAPNRAIRVRQLHGAQRIRGSAVNDTFGSLRGFMDTVKATLFNRYEDPGALRLLDEMSSTEHAGPLVQIETQSLEETRA